MSNDDIIKILSQIAWGIPLNRISKLYVLMSLIRNNGNRTHTVKDVKLSIRTVRNRISEMNSEGLKYKELENQER
jgi:hypothetical protein